MSVATISTIQTLTRRRLPLLSKEIPIILTEVFIRFFLVKTNGSILRRIYSHQLKLFRYHMKTNRVLSITTNLTHFVKFLLQIFSFIHNILNLSKR